MQERDEQRRWYEFQSLISDLYLQEAIKWKCFSIGYE